MPKIILLIAIIVGLWYWWSYQKNLAETKRRPFLWKSGFWLVLGSAVYLVITGRMHWLGAGIAAIVPIARALLIWGGRAMPLLRILGRFKSTPSQFRTQSLLVTINFANGQIFGEILDGDFAGRQLSELTTDELQVLSDQLKTSDRESYILLQAYLLRSGNSSNHQSQDSYQPNSYSQLSTDEAYEVLGLPSSASKAEVIKAHKRLMQRLHPDRGGSDYLAAKINAAKDKLI
jgi:hypothetical protein